MSVRRLALSIVAATLAACASSTDIKDFYDADSKTLQRFVDMKVVDNTNGFTSLGTVTGLYCHKGIYGGQSQEIDYLLAEREAVDQAKLKAAASGTTYMSRPVCEHKDKGTLTNNCFSMVTCTTEALTKGAR
jgi:hypothetical protein